MIVDLRPEIEDRLSKLAQQSSRSVPDLVEEAMRFILTPGSTNRQPGSKSRKSTCLTCGRLKTSVTGCRLVIAKAQGRVWWANLPEPLGWRPVLILTRNAALPKLHYASVAPLTRTIRGIDSEVILETEAGVPSRCAITLATL
jgi:hypothetical protein